MSIESQLHPGGIPQVSNVDYAALQIKVEGLLADMAQLTQMYGRSEAASSIEDTYEKGDNPILKHLAKLLTRAERQALMQDRLDADRNDLHSGLLSHDQRQETSHHYETLRYTACEYNHLVRSFIESHREDVSHQQLGDWLTEASRGHRRWADGEITGATSEIALHAALMGMPELRGLRYATLDEDLHGFDFTAEWQGQQVTIDAKTGRYAPIAERMRGHRHLEIYVPREAMDGFRLTRGGLDSLRREMRVALVQAARLQIAA
jgi:hypothetical protein